MKKLPAPSCEPSSVIGNPSGLPPLPLPGCTVVPVGRTGIPPAPEPVPARDPEPEPVVEPELGWSDGAGPAEGVGASVPGGPVFGTVVPVGSDAAPGFDGFDDFAGTASKATPPATASRATNAAAAMTGRFAPALTTVDTRART